ncbi:ribosome maturation factor RimM [Helicobacter brantae]|uniref:Ribosome maturation factor RimM n=1 Tax=Helicobacter brantae TaxID=375927 RepID=A0A3D8IX20_9HELI|nr:ribosome maturation factor RimM [Helicobacter brantae]RDU69121.1 16S rRNA processing protein RimM [Helicobacter brantae]
MIQVAKIGKTSGVYGGLKLHLLSDFPQILSQDINFTAKSLGLKPQTLNLKIKSYQNGIVTFEGYESRESAGTLTNFILYASKEDTKKYCTLKEGEAFWFDVIGMEVVEGEEILGEVIEIERIGAIDYLIIASNLSLPSLPPKKPSKTFMLPYINRYILEMREGKIYTQDAKDIWFAS